MKDMNTLSSTDAAAKRIDWSAWLDEYGSQFLLYARQQCRNESDAEDVMQDALVQLVRVVESGSFTGTQDQWRAYVFTAIRHLAMDLGRRMSVRRTYETAQQEHMSEGEEETPWLSCAADNEYLRVRIESMLRKLSPEKAEVVVLHIWGELTFQQIADVTGNKLSTITSRYRYALEDLRKALGDNSIEC
ncbi:MAG: sigma-70 family RNA polymerase sigma factor [Akkermansia sp.]|nr:sigma-70 family RNA polymerase sigma factor [Akkermansia sp.]